MNELRIMTEKADTILIAGHIRPDGDCVGACIAAYHYLTNCYPEKEITVYLEALPEKFQFMDAENKIITQHIEDKEYDFFLALDSSDVERLGEAGKYFYSAKTTMCVDHHISNKGYAVQNFIDPKASSACEVLYGLLSDNEINYQIAEALYIGILFDSGNFRYSNTSRKTLEIAGFLIEKGIPFWNYIDKCFYQRTYTQAQLLGRTLLESMRIMDGKCIVAVITRKMMRFYGAKTEDIDGIVDQLRITEGVEVAILLHEIGEQEYKVSLRSNDYVDVCQVATYYNGGGHIKAAGCTMSGSMHDVVNNLTKVLERQLK